MCRFHRGSWVNYWKSKKTFPFHLHHGDGFPSPLYRFRECDGALPFSSCPLHHDVRAYHVVQIQKRKLEEEKGNGSAYLINTINVPLTGGELSNLTFNKKLLPYFAKYT